MKNVEISILIYVQNASHHPVAKLIKLAPLRPGLVCLAIFNVWMISLKMLTKIVEDVHSGDIIFHFQARQALALALGEQRNFQKRNQAQTGRQLGWTQHLNTTWRWKETPHQTGHQVQ